jgi:hypothetical protein
LGENVVRTIAMDGKLSAPSAHRRRYT